MGVITMRQVILGARVAGSRIKSDQVPFPARTMRPAAPLWFAATLVVIYLVDAPGSGGAAHAQSNGIAGKSPQLAQAKTNRGTYGTRGDANKARDLYTMAEAGGIKEAKARFEALH